jgi:hypothetical protein
VLNRAEQLGQVPKGRHCLGDLVEGEWLARRRCERKHRYCSGLLSLRGRDARRYQFGRDPGF